MKIKYGNINKLYNKTMLDEQIKHWQIEYKSTLYLMKKQEKLDILTEKDYDYYEGMLNNIDEFITSLKSIKKAIK